MKRVPVPERGLILVRNVGLDVYKRFKIWASERGLKLGPAVTEAMREKMQREKEK